MGSAVRLRITPPQIELLGTISVWLSGVRIVVETRLMRFTVPATPAASISSPRSKGRVPRIKLPAARFASVFWSAKPTASPAMPKPGSTGASCTPSWVRITAMPNVITAVPARRESVARISSESCDRSTARRTARRTRRAAQRKARKVMAMSSAWNSHCGAFTDRNSPRCELQAWSSHLGEFLSVKAPQWLFQALLIAITFLAFRWAARLVRRAVRRAVLRSQLSELMRATLSRLAGTAVMTLGIAVILTQLGVQLAPVLPGFGIAGLAVGFALQNTLANLAAGSLILGTRPFDLGDEIEAAGVAGTVKRMSLVSTTILTPDNQTLIVPNSSIWGGVIRNRTAEPIRRVDLTFSVAYGDDVDRVERVLAEVVRANDKVLT